MPADVEVTGSYICDIYVVGAGISGLAAALTASQAGASVVCIEAISITGGGGRGTEGAFGVGSKMQEAAGIKIDPVVVWSAGELPATMADGAYTSEPARGMVAGATMSNHAILSAILDACD